jgi:hypothetical protein
MAARMTLSDRQIGDLQGICRLPTTVIQSIHDFVAMAANPPLHPEQIRNGLPQPDSQRDDVTALIRMVLGLINVARHLRWTAEQVLDAAGDSVSEKCETEPAFNRTSWNERVPVLASILNNSRFQTVAKAVELSYDYMNLLQTARVITDIRPLYDDPTGEELQGLIVTYTLRLMYTSAGEPHTLSIALDDPDLDRLEEQCRRARTKARTVLKGIARPLELPALITGRQDDNC